MAEFRMPSLGADMQEGTLIEWSVKPGDRVKRGDIIGVVRTEKADIEVEVYHDGVVDQLLAKAGQTLPVGAVLAVIREEGEAEVAPEKPAAGQIGRLPQEAEVTPAKPPEVPMPPGEAVGRVRASPLARRVAQELAIDLSQVHGTGPRGEITQEDVQRAAEAAKEAPPMEKLAPPDFRAGMRRAIAAAMARSNREIPHYYLETKIDLQRALKFLEAANQKRSVRDRLLSVVLLIKAVARALRDVPELNAYWIDDQLQPKEAVHVGFAISLRQGGLVVPAIMDAGRKNLDQLMEALRDLITRARSGRLRSSEITDGTVTITNLGDLGVEAVHGVIYPPQVALVGFGRIIESPWAENGMLGIRPIVTATLAGDHRATDGHRGAQFLTALNQHLQEPEKL
jgi:pyruvate dehydrogenase E2 component (dihydrolipoyllysine-residue acetyltransferase)